MANATPGKAAILMFGPPGSGKGTVSKVLMARFGTPHVSTGDMLRENVQAGTELGRQAKAIMDSGKLVSDELVNRLADERIRRADCAGGLILDGYPRTIEQGQVLMQLLAELGLEPVVVFLDVDYNIIIRRLTARRSCPKCGAVYNLESKPPKAGGLCEADDTPVAIRDDDREEVIRQRFLNYERQTQPLVDFFAGKVKRFFRVTVGEGSPQENSERVVQTLLNG
ncbi:MAG: nucleoside monophosphate kinase [Acidobacteria bacterium]|nr:nucleoside monophosphate kinase [Acidobacteriota bacterium]